MKQPEGGNMRSRRVVSINSFVMSMLALALVAQLLAPPSAVECSQSAPTSLIDVDEDVIIDANIRNDYYSLHLDDGRGTGGAGSSYVIKSNYSQQQNLDANKDLLLAAAMDNDESFKHLADTNDFAVKYIWRRMPIGFLVLGTIANILSIIVFTRKEMRKYSSFCYFAVLNVVNLAFLYVTLTRVIMDFNFKSDIRTLNIFTCKSHVFLTYFLGHLSSLLLSTISIDRVISVVFLHRAKELCTPRVAFMVTAFLIAFNFVVSSHFIIFDSAHTVDTHINITVTNAKKINKSFGENLLASMSSSTPSMFSEVTTAEAAFVSHTHQQHQHHHQHHNQKSKRDLLVLRRDNFELKDITDHEYELAVSNLVPSSSELSGEKIFENEIVESKVVCDTRNGTFYHYFIRNTWKLIDMSLYAFFPFAIMFTCSVIIIIRVAQQSNKFKARTYKGTGSQKQKKSTDMNRVSSPNISQSVSRRATTETNMKNKASIHSLKPKLAEPTTTLDNGFQNESLDPSSSMRSSVNGLDRTASVAEQPLGKVKPSLSLAPTAQIMNRNSIGTNPMALAKLRSSSSVSTPASINPNHRPSEAKFSTRTRNLALMLIPVNILFLAFLSPVVICMYTYENLGNDQLTLAIVEHLSYCNFTLNFFIYFLTSSKFREEFFKFLNETFRTSTPQNNSAYANTYNNRSSSCLCFKWRLPFLKKKPSSPAPNGVGASDNKTRYQSINNKKSSMKQPTNNPTDASVALNAATYASSLTTHESNQSKPSPRLASKFNQLISSKNKDDDELVAMTTTYLSGNDQAE